MMLCVFTKVSHLVFSLSALTLLSCWWCHFDWSFARHIASVVTTTSITLNSNEIQNGDILVLANPVPPGKMAVKTERGRSHLLVSYLQCVHTCRMVINQVTALSEDTGRSTYSAAVDENNVKDSLITQLRAKNEQLSQKCDLYEQEVYRLSSKLERFIHEVKLEHVL